MAEFTQNIKSQFNEGFFQTQRLNKLQDEINDVKKNPLAFNLTQNCYNYLVWFRNLQCLYTEALGKLKPEEVKDLEQLEKFIKDGLKIMPPHITIVNQSTNSVTTKIKQKNWDFIERAIQKYEKYVKFSLEAHGLANPNIDDGALF